jgi:hypothetical protein
LLRHDRFGSKNPNPSLALTHPLPPGADIGRKGDPAVILVAATSVVSMAATSVGSMAAMSMANFATVSAATAIRPTI